MDHSSIHRKFGIQCNFLESLQIRQRIPLTWRRLLTRHENQCANYDVVDDVYVRIKKKLPISQSETKLIYQYFIDEKSQPPVCIGKMTKIYPDIKNEEWNEIFKHTFLITRETKLQTFQYKIIHRIINCNKKLYDMKIKTTPTYSYCDEMDDIIHFFVLCPETYRFWVSFPHWWNIYTPTGNPLYHTILPEGKQIIFGITSHKSDPYVVLNYCVMHAKYNIYKQSYRVETI